MSDYVYLFENGSGDMRELLGGKGAGLAEMSSIGIPVPPGFTITTEVCTYYYDNGKTYPAELDGLVRDAVKAVEARMGQTFGDPSNPLLFSVRSGARVSMPGMMDTVLNLGLNDEIVEGLAKQVEDRRFAYDSYRRFVQMYGDVVLDLKPQDKKERDPFEVLLEAKKDARGVKLDTELSADDLVELVAEFKAAIKERTGRDFPEDPWEQLFGAVGAVFTSWNNDRAIAYRQMNDIPGEWGTAVNVQTMVFGNMGDDSGSGVAFTRDPRNGENIFYGEYLINSQGEDVVAGTRTPQPINEESRSSDDQTLLSVIMPGIYQELDGYRHKLENHFGDMQDIEFTVQKGKLWMLQTRTGKRTSFAACRIAISMLREGFIDQEEALMRIDPEGLNQYLQPVFDDDARKKAIAEGAFLAKGLNAGPGAATGKVVFHASDACEWVDRGEEVILVRLETSPEDIRGMKASTGILTSRGGMTSHAALVARQMGKVCVAGCESIHVDYARAEFSVAGKVIKEGDWITLDGYTGEVLKGKIPTLPSEVNQVLIDGTLPAADSPRFQEFNSIMQWADAARQLKVRANADGGVDASRAISFGAEGIGLARTEHMFFGEEKLPVVREMILAATPEKRQNALDRLLPMQRKNFVDLFTNMDGRPVTIRTLDPPLHEFLPHEQHEKEAVARHIGITVHDLEVKMEQLSEINPMIGHRGCRLGIVYPEITAMQARAIFEAVIEVKKAGKSVVPEIMIPFISSANELRHQAAVVRRVAKEVLDASDMDVEYLVGTMIELPRAALTADQVADVAEFFSFGTNDLTQTTFGLSRDDAGKFLPYYLEKEIIEGGSSKTVMTNDPFKTIDQEGVGQLIKMAVEKGRGVNPTLKIGICGEHGGDPKSVAFCHRIGLDYVSCSPFRVPIARVAAGQVAVEEKRKAAK